MVKKITEQIFQILFIVVICILLIMSLLSIISIHWTFFKTTIFSFTPSGINNYISGFSGYKELLGGTIATLAAYFGLLQFKTAIEANKSIHRENKFSDWKNVLDVRFVEIERHDSRMKREFIRIRYNLFNQLYDYNFTINNREQLTEIFQSHFVTLIRFFEEQNDKHVGMGGVYPNNTYSYSFDSFRFLLLGCVDTIYPTTVDDLQTLYLSAMDNDRIINVNMYQNALQNYTP